MKELRWDKAKSRRLQQLRGAGFEDVIAGRLLGVEKNLARPGQWLMVFEVDAYAWVIPCVDGDDHYFLKTAFPSRKYTKVYLQGS